MSETQDTQMPVEQATVEPVVEKKERKRRNLSEDARKRLSDAAKNGTWAQHLKSFREANPDIKGKHVYSEASKTYKKAEKAAPAEEKKE